MSYLQYVMIIFQNDSFKIESYQYIPCKREGLTQSDIFDFVKDVYLATNSEENKKEEKPYLSGEGDALYVCEGGGLVGVYKINHNDPNSMDLNPIHVMSDHAQTIKKFAPELIYRR